MINSRSGLGLPLVGLLLLSVSLAAWSVPAAGSDALWTAQAFQRLAIVDREAAADVWMQEGVRRQWVRDTENVLEAPINCAALFSSMAWFSSSADSAQFAALFNPWLGALLILQLDEAATEIIGIHLAMLPFDALPAGNVAGLTDALRVRMSQGAATFIERIDQWPSSGSLGTEESAWSGLRSELGRYVSTLRGVLSPDAQVGEELRENVLRVMDRLSSDSLDGALAVASGQSATWTKSLAPVWLVDGESSAELTFGSLLDPFTFLRLEVSAHSTDEPIIAAAIIELAPLLSPAEGGTP